MLALNESHARLAQSERKYRELVENANSIILRWACDGCISFINEFGQKFFGYSEPELLGRNVVGTIVPATESGGRDLQRLMEQIRVDPAAFEQNTNENIRRDGERVWIAWTNKIAWDAQGRVAEILSIGLDITERRRAEEEVRRLNNDLQHHAEELERRVVDRTAQLAVARDRAESADRLKSVFLATMSHELRTPLNSIVGFTGVMLQGLAGPLNEEQTKQLGIVQKSARHLLALINDVLDISKIEAGEVELVPTLFDLRASIDKVVAIVQPLADRKGLALRLEVAAGVGYVRGDARRVEQILLNLLGNAVKFTETGAVTLAAELVDDFLPAPPAAPRPAVRLRVADTGIGIKPENMIVLFEPFRQVDSGLSRIQEGTGLGLAICKRIIEAHGGRIRAENRPAGGAAIVMTLPVRASAQAPAGPGPARWAITDRAS